MATKRETIVNKARETIGIKEGTAAHKQIIDAYNSKQSKLPRGYAVKYSDEWCATYISYLAIVCNATDIIPTECGCEEMIKLMQDKGIWQENDNYKPTAGDIIFYNWNGGTGENTGWAHHVGIVESVSGNIINIIEGNKSNAVNRRVIAIGDKYIRGYGVPRYTKQYNTVNSIKVGDTVIVKDGAKTYTNQSLAPFVYGREHKVLEIKGDRVVITYRGVVVCAIRKTDLKKV